MDTITTIASLTSALNNVTINEYPKIIKKIALPSSEIIDFATWSKNNYTRNCLARTKQYEIILICWDVNAVSAIHCHGGNKCWVYQITGELKETRFKKNKTGIEKIQTITLSSNKISYMDDSMGYHNIGNFSSKKAMSLHIYAKPIDTCTIYNEDNEHFETQDLEYDTFKENYNNFT